MSIEDTFQTHLVTWLCGDKEPFLCNTPPNLPEGSLKCANLVSIYSCILFFVSALIIRVAQKKMSLQSDEMINLFGVSIFSIRLYKLIVYAEKLNMVIMVWHPVMMYVNNHLQHLTISIERDNWTIGCM